MGSDTNPRCAAPARRALRVAACWLAISALALAGLAFAGAAGAAGTLGDQTGTNTDFTPNTQTDGTKLGWTQFDGALFGKHGRMVGDPPSHDAPSQTPFTVDFFTVRFSDESNGFAAGAVCADSSTPFDKLDVCSRVPTIWQFKDGQWQQVALPGGAGDPDGKPTPGYVGAIAYMADGKVLAVGGGPLRDSTGKDVAGTGVYPRRESATPLDTPTGAPNPNYQDPAGVARAWLYDGSRWTELTSVQSQLQKLTDTAEKVAAGQHGEAPGGLTALDCSQNPKDFSSEYCVAGGLHQLFTWRGGKSPGFTAAYDDNSKQGWANASCAYTIAISNSDPVRSAVCGSAADPSLTSSATELRFRVRDIRWVAPSYTGNLAGVPTFVAVTAGCCAQVAANSDGTSVGARLLQYGSSTGLWSAVALNELGALTSGAVTSAALADSYYSVVVSAPAGTTAGTLPGRGISILASPGAQVSSNEPNARIIYDRIDSGTNNSADYADVLDSRLTGVRLVSADGDSGSPSANAWLVGNGTGRDGLLDWAVGDLTGNCSPTGSTDCRGAAYTTLRQAQPTPDPSTCTASDLPSPIGHGNGVPTTCAPAPSVTNGGYMQSLTGAISSSQELMYLPSYALNAITDVPGQPGEAWAVGDKGALLRLGGNGTVGASNEPAAPELTGTWPTSLFSDRSAYQAGTPAAPSRESGAVPAVASQPLLRLATPALLPLGSPDPDSDRGGAATSIAMSRDGTEGWATGGSSTLYHYVGGTWIACDDTGIGGQLASDNACSALSGLRAQGAVLTALVRVPTAKDADPSNADDFQVMAFGQGQSPGEVVVARYRRAHWELMDGKGGRANWMTELGAVPRSSQGIGFVSPTDGWVTAPNGRNGQLLYHFDGQHWHACADSAAVSSAGPDVACGDPGGILPLPNGYAQGNWQFAVAGRRIYLGGTRLAPQQGSPYPLIYYKDPAGNWTASNDPGCEEHNGASTQGASPPPSACLGSSSSAKQGAVTAISAAQLPDGHFAGWAAGTFGAGSKPGVHNLTYAPQDGAPPSPEPGQSGLLRLDSADGSWQRWPVGDAASDYLFHRAQSSVAGIRLITSVSASGQEHSFLLPPTEGVGAVAEQMYPLLRFDVAKGRWQVLPTPWLAVGKQSDLTNEAAGQVQALVPDGSGGLWMASQSTSTKDGDGTANVGNGPYFYHYTDRWPHPVFADIAHPIREPIAGTAADPGGSFWVATESNAVYRYDRLTGWDRMTIPGWDPGRIVTNSSPAHAIAVGADGSGVLVGKAGRIADLSAAGGALDAASGVLCGAVVNRPPCSTGYDLRAVAVAPDGSAIVGGDHMALLWRPAGGQFRAIAKPPEKSQDMRITGLSMPAPDHAWLTTDAGQVFGATKDTNDHWTWTLEADALTLTQGWDGKPLQLHAIAVDGSGQGLAVGSEGLVLQRGGDGIWRRIDTGRLDTFYSVALPAQGFGDGALIGGELGLILTRVNGRFEVARPSDYYSGLTNGDTNVNSGRIVGVGVTSGYKSGDIEAWAALQMQPQSGGRPAPWPGAILHYTNTPGGSLLDGGNARAVPLPNSSVQAGEVSFATFGKQECQLTQEPTCPEMQGTNFVNEQISRVVTEAIAAEGKRQGGPSFALYTGDVGNSGGRDQGAENSYPGVGGPGNAPLDTDVIHHRWTELVAEPLQDAGTALFGGVGGQDLSQTSACDAPIASIAGCPGTRTLNAPGGGFGWRESFASMPAPWGAPTLADGSANKPPPDSHGLSFVPVPDSQVAGQGTSVEGPSASVCPSAVDAGGQSPPVQTVPCATPPVDTGQQSQALSQASGQNVPSGQAGGQSVPSQSASAGGAHTHYAVDVVRGGKAVLRLVVVDTSLKTLSGAAGEQNPAEAQLQWLSDALSKRPAGERAVVVSETPSYSYGPGATTDTLTDSAAFEALMGQYHVDAVVSGRLGWNGLYYTSTLAPGLHCPQPGGSYPDPRGCDPTSGAAGAAAQGTQAAGGALAQALSGTAPGTAAPNKTLSAYPTVVAASAGGKFGPADNASSGPAAAGYWHGYSMIRLEPDGSVNVIQRPVFDWVGIQAAAHALRPGQHVTLKGYGREPVGMDQPIQYDDINSPAITHRYDLVAADPQRPWVPKVDPALVGPDNPGGYAMVGQHAPAGACQDPVACIDSQTGLISTGKGNHPRVYAIGILSVGDKAASWPIALEPRRSFRAPATPPLRLPALPIPRVLASPAANLPSVQPPPNPPPLNFQFPTPPQVPNLPPLSAPAVRPPTPPVPPPPPANVSPSALNISPAAVGLNVAPPATVIPPPAPPIQPAPPGGARKEARQRQAAAAKSEEGASSETQEQAGDLSTRPPDGSASATRRDRVKPGPSITTIAHRDQPSAWARGALYGGGLTLAALTLAFGFTTLRPGPRRRRPEIPAPAWNRQRRH